jgi:hypothetical protein
MILELLFAAATFNVCWQNPTENVDESTLDDLTSVTIYYDQGNSVNEGSLVFPTTEAGAELCTDVEVPQAGDYSVRATATDAEGNESTFSNQVVKAAVDSAPEGPIIIEEERQVFTVVKQPDQFLLLPVGTVPAGTQCDPTNTTNGHMVVPAADVVWTSPTGSRPIVVVADCL